MSRRLSLAWLAAFTFGIPHPSVAQSVEVRVDPGVELIATVFRLAGRPEYNITRVAQWSSAVDAHFAPFREHSAVTMTKRLGFGFFIPMNLAIHLTPPPGLAERVPFASATSLHRRWTMLPDSTRVYVELLRAFARDSRFADFMTANRPLADSAQARLRRVGSAIDQRWLSRFWGGTDAMKFVLVAALTNGGASYGQEYLPASGTSEFQAIIGAGRADALGFPQFDSTDAPTVLHEMNHPYVSPLIRANTPALRPAADSLFQTVATRMRAQAYGSWDAMLNESLVRAAVPPYYMAHGDSARAERIVGEEISSGFLWMKELVDLFGEYERNRNTYPTMNAFMPRITAFFDDWSRRPR
jgi:hypothetical protein